MSWIKKNVPKDVADYLFNIRIQLPSRVGLVQRDVRPDVLIDFDLLESQLADTPEMLAYWDLLLAEQNAKVAALIRRSIMLRSEATRRILEDARASNIDHRRTDLEDLVEIDENVTENEANIVIETRNFDRVKAVVNSLKMKSEHLRSLAGFKRKEREETRA